MKLDLNGSEFREIGPAHAALHDVLFLKASTQFYFTSRKYDQIISPPVDLSNLNVAESTVSCLGSLCFANLVPGKQRSEWIDS